MNLVHNNSSLFYFFKLETSSGPLSVARSVESRVIRFILGARVTTSFFISLPIGTFPPPISSLVLSSESKSKIRRFKDLLIILSS